ncbi:sulfotransferase 1A1-like isoform X2 [Haliotis rubra]|uniref:sulfotransferase 1A1-like isoform X2 n=1 Tax=Haliotis rubra TaxID=36100 RepID=UPI001EE50B11|nr:sulfotransferase 1A1-like isoform X2 [Haliotis rubra]
MLFKMSSTQSDEQTVMNPNIGEVLDLRNAKGHGFYCYEYDGLYLFVPPPSVLKGGHHVDKLRSISEAELKDDDIMICAYPKCGTHWLWEVTKMLISGTIKYEKGVKESRMLEWTFKDGIEAVPPPRVFNTHLPLRMLPKQVVEKKIKCIQIMRNPKDVCVSYFNHLRDRAKPWGYDGDFSEFTETFLAGKLPDGSYPNYLRAWKVELAAAPDLPVLHLFYEEMLLNPLRTVKDIARFLGLSSTDQFCEDVADACSFKKMKKVDQEMKTKLDMKIWADGSEGTFYRKGEIGDWKNWFTVAENERFDQIWNAKMKDSGFEFTYAPA